MTITEALERFLLQLEADGRSPHTIGQYRRHIATLAAWCRDVSHSGQVFEITHEDLARFLTSPQARTSARGGNKKAASVNCLRASLKGFFRYIHRAGYIADDPSAVIRRARCGQTNLSAFAAADLQHAFDSVASPTRHLWVDGYFILQVFECV